MGVMDSLRDIDKQNRREKSDLDKPKKEIKPKKEMKETEEEHGIRILRSLAFAIGFISNYSLMVAYGYEISLFTAMTFVSCLIFGYIFSIIAYGLIKRSREFALYGTIIAIIGFVSNWTVTFFIPDFTFIGILLIGGGITLIEIEEYKDLKSNKNTKKRAERFIPLLSIVGIWVYSVIVMFAFSVIGGVGLDSALENIQFKDLDVEFYLDEQNNCIAEMIFVAYNIGDDVSNVVAHTWIVNEHVTKNIGDMLKGGEVDVDIIKTFLPSECGERPTYYEPWFTSG